MSAPIRLAIDIWSDIMCPWCVIGYHQLRRALDELDGEIAADIRWHPFELNPDMPEEGADMGQHMLRKYGRPPSDHMSRQMQAVAAEAGYTMRYLGKGDPPPRRLWNTHRAHKLLAWALDTQGPEAQTRLKLALFDAYFQQYGNVSDPENLFAIAESIGLAMDGAREAMGSEALSARIRTEEREAMEKGITSVPMMLVERRFMIPGAQDLETYKAYLRKVVGRLKDADG